jgi:chemotaxis signal transduction protein
MTNFDETQIARILDARTAQLAARASAPVREETRSLIACAVGRNFYGVNVREVAEVLPFERCTPVLGAPHGMLGLFGRSGHVYNVLDMAALSAADAHDSATADGHLLLLRKTTPRAALRCGRVLGVVSASLLSSDEVSAKETAGEAVSGYARSLEPLDGTDDRILALLSLDFLVQRYFTPPSASGVPAP